MKQCFSFAFVTSAMLLISACVTTNSEQNGVVNQNASPISIPPPVYPSAAVHRHLRGLCDIEFDIDPQGRTQNIDVSCNYDVFEPAAREAVERWRYNPRIVNGVPNWRNGVVTSFDFNLANH